MSEPLSILHVVIVVNATSAQYNEHCLPVMGDRQVALCSYRPATLRPPTRIALFEGDGTRRGFTAALDQAFAEGTYDVVHVHAPQTAILYLGWARRRRGSLPPAVCTVHNSFGSFGVKNRLLLFPVFASFPRVVMCSRSARDSFPRLWRALGRDRVVVVPNGVDTDRVDRALDRAWFVPTGRRSPGSRVVSVGRLIPRKDPLTVLRAFALASEAEDALTFVGAGPLADEVMQEASRLGISRRVEVTGTVAREDVYRHLAAADLFVSASTNEGLPVAVLEAMACGRPMILSDIGPHREVTEDLGVPLVAPGDVARFADALGWMRALPKGVRVDMGARGRDLVEARFSVRSMHRGYEAVYRTVMGDQPNPVTLERGRR